MPEIREIPAFAARAWSNLTDGHYITVRSGRIRAKSQLEARYGPDGRSDDDEQDDLDELFLTEDDLADALTDVVMSLRGSGTVWIELYARGRKRPSDRVIVDQWPDDEQETPSLGKLTSMARGDVSAAALAKAFDSRNMQIDGLIREVKSMARDAREAAYREIEAVRASTITEVEARIVERFDDSQARAEERAEMRKMLHGLADRLGPVLLGRFTGPPPAPRDPDAPPPSEGTVEAEVDAMIEQFRHLLDREGGAAAVMQRQAELIQLAQMASMKAAGGAA